MHPATQSPDYLKNSIISADVSAALRELPSTSVHLTFTSPPYYNARDYATYASYEDYLKFLVAVFTETHRVTKEGRFLVVNTSPVIEARARRSEASKRYAIPYDLHPRLTAIGWEFIDDITWLKPESAAKNRNGGFYQHRKPLGYKTNPITESVMVYRRKTDKLIDWNMRQYDTETVESSKITGPYEKTNVWHINPATDSIHPAVFPVELATRIIQFYSFKNDLVFDPFGGSGTVGLAAMRLGRYFLLCEKKVEYVERITERTFAGLFSYPETENPALTYPRVLSLTELKKEFA